MTQAFSRVSVMVACALLSVSLPAAADPMPSRAAGPHVTTAPTHLDAAQFFAGRELTGN